MNRLLFALTLLISLQAQADNFMIPENVASGGVMGFEKKTDCDRRGQRCQKVDGLDLEVLGTIEVEVDDLTKPVYEAKSNAQLHASRALANAAIAVANYCPGTHIAIVADEGSQWESYCTRLLGYQKKMVPQIVEDSVKKQAKADRLSEEVAKSPKQQALRTELRDCVITLKGSATAAQVRACALVLLKDRLKEEIKASDL